MSMWISEATGLSHEGKTKQVFYFENNVDLVRLYAKDDITGGNGKRHAILPGKGVLATTTTVNTFRMLRRRAVPVAFVEQDSPRSFIAENCTMIELEVVGRWKMGPKSSLRARQPSLPVTELFDKPLVEFFLKTSGRRWRNRELPCDDPYLELNTDAKELSWSVYEPDKPLTSGNELFRLPLSALDLDFDDINNIIRWTITIAEILRDAWDHLQCDIHDFKVEYGFPMTKERLLVADVLDNDSWRLFWDGKDISKQPFRDGAPLDEVMRNYQLVAEFSNHFPL